MKKIIFSVLIIICVLSIGITTYANTYTLNKSYNENNYKELLGLSNVMYSTDDNSEYDDKLNIVMTNKISDLILSNDVITIEKTGESTFIDIIAKYENGTFDNISNIVEWKSENPDIVYADNGRILALDKGTTTVTVSFLEFTKTIEVNVLETCNIQKEILELESIDHRPISPNSYLRNYVTNKAKQMVEVSWKPRRNLKGWRGKYTFKAGTTYRGIPYSQTAFQKDNIGFKNSLRKNDFYNNYTRFSKTMPKYGNDCSGFVSFAWGTSRKTTSNFVNGIKNGTYSKVGSYNANNPSRSHLIKSYRKLRKGDAVVKQGHTFLIASNSTKNSKVYVYEQTPYKALYTTWTYNQMANAKYMPFTLKYMDSGGTPQKHQKSGDDVE